MGIRIKQLLSLIAPSFIGNENTNKYSIYIFLKIRFMELLQNKMFDRQIKVAKETLTFPLKFLYILDFILTCML